MSIRSVARVFADVNSNKPESYWNYDDFSIKYGDIDKYALIERIGRGKYSEVFHGENLVQKKDVVIKVLKPVRSRKINREISILSNLANGVNIINMVDVVYYLQTNTPALIFEYLECSSAHIIMNRFRIYETQFYLFELLKALKYCHGKGIMHRDVKPQNIIINPTQHTLKLIDWGLAEYYHPGQKYNVRVASRYFKGPELLVNFEEYDYSLDMWSTGCILASLLFRTEPFFHGSDNEDQLVKIINVLGTRDFDKYLIKYSINISLTLKNQLESSDRKKLLSFLVSNKSNPSYKLGVDLLEKLFQYDHQFRLTAQEAMDHAFFDQIR